MEEITEQWVKDHVAIVPIDKVKPNTWNFMGWDEEEFEKFKESIKRRGFKSVLLGRKVGDMFEVEDGEHRFKALKELGYKTVPIFLTEDDDVDARGATIDFNLRKGEPDSLKLAELIRDLHKKYKLSLEEIEQKIGFTPTEIQSYLDLLDFDWEEFETPESSDDDGIGEDLVVDEVIMYFTVTGEFKGRVEDVLNAIRKKEKIVSKDWQDEAFVELIKEKEKQLEGGEE